MSKARIVKVSDASSDMEFFISELADKLLTITSYMAKEMREKDFDAQDVGNVIYMAAINYIAQISHKLTKSIDGDTEKFIASFKENLLDAIDVREDLHKDCKHH